MSDIDIRLEVEDTRIPMEMDMAAVSIRGTTDYLDLEHKPAINGVELSGNKTAADLGLSDVFWAVYGSTTSAEIEAAHQAGKVVLVPYGAMIFRLSRRNSGEMHFFAAGLTMNSLNTYYLSCIADAWTFHQYAPSIVSSVNGQTGDVTVSDVFWATFGETTSEDLHAAFAAGRQVCVKHSGGFSSDYSEQVFHLDWEDSPTLHYFHTDEIDLSKRLSIVCSNDVWRVVIGSRAALYNPAPLGTAAPGASGRYAREDHVHPMPSAADVGAPTLEQLMAAYPKDTASGAIASFEDGANNALVADLTVAIAPKQAGSGTPSPSNVRAISGWTGANIVVSPTQDAQDGTTYTISFGSAGTVYGGTLDVTTGKLSVDWFGVTCDGTTETWAMAGSGSQQRFQMQIQENGWPLPGANTPANAVSSHFAYSATSYSAFGNFRLGGTPGSNRYIICGDNEQHFASLSDVTAWVAQQYSNGTPLMFAYRMAESVEYNLTPTEVRTLLGVNNIWSDTGDTTVEYRADTGLYIDKKIAEVQALVLES